jgi:hypothetical protein
MTKIWRDTEEETIRLYTSSIFLLNSLQMTGIRLGDNSILDYQVRFIKLEKCVDLFALHTSWLVQITKIFILLHSFRRACLDSLELFDPLFLLCLFPQTPHCYISALFSSVHSATFVGNATEATCRLLRIPFRFDSHERNPKSAQLFPPPPRPQTQRSVFTHF